ncbi:MAG: aspartate aminotransferase family protein [Bacteroidales bacterium]
MNRKELFLKYVGQTSPYPLGLEVARAEGCFLYDPQGKKYFDLISGFSVSNIGHSNPRVIEAIREQAGRYLHTMVYGELVQTPQVMLARTLVDHLPAPLEMVYFVNSGAEAVEGALKLAKRQTGRHQLVCFSNAYHGSTHGALSIMGSETYKTAFRPLLPSVKILEFNSINQLNEIDQTTAAVIVEPIQAEAGIILPNPGFLAAIRKRCNETGALLIFDEIQTGFGRTGSLFALGHEHVTPDILVLAKALGGGMPLGAFISSREMMLTLTSNPALGHVTTFGGHPVSCAAGLASLNLILEEKLPEKADKKGKLIRERLIHRHIKEVRGRGLLIAARLDSPERVNRFFANSLKNGLLFDFFLFCKDSIRIAPPLIISGEEIDEMIRLILKTLDES